MTAAPSRAVLSRWASELLNEPIGTAPEKKCTNGVIYCKLLEAVRPGTLNLTKVNVSADAEHSSLANYRILAAGLEKAGVTVNIDAGTLSKGQPAATLDLLHRLFALANPQAPPQKGLAPLDANALPGDRRAGKRRAAEPAPAPAPPKRAASAVKDAPAEAGETAGEVVASTPVEEVLRQQLEDAKLATAMAKAETANLVEERDFYMRKLECIEDACMGVPSESLAQSVLKLLGADEDEIETATAALM